MHPALILTIATAAALTLDIINVWATDRAATRAEHKRTR